MKILLTKILLLKIPINEDLVVEDFVDEAHVSLFIIWAVHRLKPLSAKERLECLRPNRLFLPREGNLDNNITDLLICRDGDWGKYLGHWKGWSHSLLWGR